MFKTLLKICSGETGVGYNNIIFLSLDKSIIVSLNFSFNNLFLSSKLKFIFLRSNNEIVFIFLKVMPSGSNFFPKCALYFPYIII